MKHFFNTTTPGHTLSAATRDAIQRLDFSVLPHPPYSPDLAPGDLHLFPKRKEHFKCFRCDEDMRSAVRKWFKKTPFLGRISQTSAALVEVC